MIDSVGMRFSLSSRLKPLIKLMTSANRRRDHQLFCAKGDRKDVVKYRFDSDCGDAAWMDL